jgi:N-acylneuraminate cytidylyltransferase/CMP-N,N'-diacetyllegionaminic acid synthase
VICAVVPARGGSKGLPRKNLRLLNGRPLLAYAVDAGLNARLVDRVIVTTDDEEIAAVARACGAEVPFMRPSELAADDTPTAPVLQHVVRWLEDHAAAVEGTVLLQPTSPLRRAHHVDAAIQLFRETGAGSVVSVCEVEHCPYWMYRLEQDVLEPFMSDAERNRARRQDLPALYRLNGAVYVTRRDVLMLDGRIVAERSRAIEMSRAESLDVEDELDLRWGEWLASARAVR